MGDRRRGHVSREEPLQLRALDRREIERVDPFRKFAREFFENGRLRGRHLVAGNSSQKRARQRQRRRVPYSPDREQHRLAENLFQIDIVAPAEIVEQQFRYDDLFRAVGRQSTREEPGLEVRQPAADGVRDRGSRGTVRSHATVRVAKGPNLDHVRQGGDGREFVGRQRQRPFLVMSRDIAVDERFAKPLAPRIRHLPLHRGFLGRHVIRVRRRFGDGDDVAPEILAPFELVVDERPEAESEGEAECQRAGADHDPDERQGRSDLLPPETAEGETGQLAESHVFPRYFFETDRRPPFAFHS